MIERIHPESEEHWLSLRKQDITSTAVSALFDACPYMTRFELYHKLAGTYEEEFVGNERTKWGSALESAIANEIAREQGWEIKRNELYIRDTELRAGSSFDFEIIGDNPGTLEIKNVDSLAFKRGWIRDDYGDLEAPVHIEIQVQHQMMLSGHDYAYIGALVGGNKLHLIRRDRHDAVIDGIKEKIQEMWRRVEYNDPPTPDWSVDAEFVSKLYGHAEPNRTIQGDKEVSDLAKRYKQCSDQIKVLESMKQECKARLLMKIGEAEKCLGDKFTISAGMVGPKEISYTRKGYRDFRINWRGE